MLWKANWSLRKGAKKRLAANPAAGTSFLHGLFDSGPGQSHSLGADVQAGVVEKFERYGIDYR